MSLVISLYNFTLDDKRNPVYFPVVMMQPSSKCSCIQTEQKLKTMIRHIFLSKRTNIFIQLKIVFFSVLLKDHLSFNQKQRWEDMKLLVFRPFSYTCAVVEILVNHINSQNLLNLSISLIIKHLGSKSVVA